MTDETANPASARSTTTLFGDALNHATGLIRKEIDLVKAEVSEKITSAAAAVGMIVGGVVIILVALNVLTAALIEGITEMGLDAGWAALIVGVVYLIIAMILVRVGTNRLKASNLAPTRTAENVRRDAQAMKESFNGKR